LQPIALFAFILKVYFKTHGIVSNVPALKQNKVSRSSDRTTARQQAQPVWPQHID
jgi:hypothetical protein